ncbi:carbohydrate kinase family protein [Sulfitobacter sp.]|uniref:carbohydrate kinase family protein n=1 Tax=Sulfitobacter sp. TaxID=1903071 RepID=UPI0030030FAA
MSLQDQKIIAVGGENLIDSVRTVSASGQERFAHKLGGSPYNVAVAMARQGARTYYLTPISRDEYGEQLTQNLNAEGVTLAGGRRDEATTQAVVTLEKGVPTYVFHRDNTAERAVTSATIMAALPDSAAHIHVGSLAFASGPDAVAWEEAFHSAARNGLTTSLDPNVRASLIDDAEAYRARLVRLLGSATLVKLSDDDLDWIYPDMSQSDAIALLMSQTTAGLVALTKGPDGAECWTATRHCTVVNPPVPNLVDTIGAGDTFMATLVADLSANDRLSVEALDGASDEVLHNLLTRAVQAACLNCAQEGCNPPSLGTLDSALIKGAA